MNVRRKWRLLVVPAAGSMVWALSAALPAWQDAYEFSRLLPNPLSLLLE